jgi:peptide/nickel transport system permease protein
MARFILRRLAFMAVTVFVVSILAFLVPYFGQADPARVIMRSRVSDLAVDQATADAIRAQLGLDQPLPVQYLKWLASALHGDFGISFTSQEPVVNILFSALQVSAVLALSALGIAALVAIPLGTLAAVRAGRPLDSIITTMTQGLIALPEFWMGPVAMLVLALWLRLLPSAGWDGPQSVIMPACVLALRPTAYITGVTRASMINVLGSPYIVAARARGLSPLSTLRRHAARNAMVPVMTLWSMWLAGLIGGSVVVEVIFAIPGMGRTMFTAVSNTDVPVIQAGLVFVVTLAVTINTVTDFAYAYLNPAVLVGQKHG